MTVVGGDSLWDDSPDLYYRIDWRSAAHIAGVVVVLMVSSMKRSLASLTKSRAYTYCSDFGDWQ
jgi:hypothetical protein